MGQVYYRSTKKRRKCIRSSCGGTHVFDEVRCQRCAAKAVVGWGGEMPIQGGRMGPRKFHILLL